MTSAGPTSRSVRSDPPKGKASERSVCARLPEPLPEAQPLGAGICLNFAKASLRQSPVDPGDELEGLGEELRTKGENRWGVGLGRERTGSTGTVVVTGEAGREGAGAGNSGSAGAKNEAGLLEPGRGGGAGWAMTGAETRTAGRSGSGSSVRRQPIWIEGMGPTWTVSREYSSPGSSTEAAVASAFCIAESIA